MHSLSHSLTLAQDNAALRGLLDGSGKGDSMHEDLLFKTLGRAFVMNLTPAEFQQAKEAYYSKPRDEARCVYY